MSDTKYCYPDTDVLINKLDIRDLDKLHIFERKLTMLRLLELLDKPINGNFDFKHLQAIHAYIFQGMRICLLSGLRIIFLKLMRCIRLEKETDAVSENLFVLWH